jgi:hypothetical protein
MSKTTEREWKSGCQPDSDATLPAWRRSAIYFRQAGSLPAKTGWKPILL